MVNPPRRAKPKRIVTSPTESPESEPEPITIPNSSAAPSESNGDEGASEDGEGEEDDDEEDDDGEGELVDDEEDAEGEEEDAEGDEEDVDVEGEEEDAEGEDDEEMDVDGEGEDEDAEGEYIDEELGNVADSRNPSYPASETSTSLPSATRSLKIKLNVKAPTTHSSRAGPSKPSSSSTRPTAGSGPGRPSRAAAKKAGKKSKKVAMEAQMPSEDEDMLFDDDEDEEGGFDSLAGSRAASPSKLTARQRAKHNKDLQETLIALPNDGINKKQLILTEAERLQRKEETARRRKRQTEQKLQDEQDQTINRLLRAQTGRSRAKLDASPADDPETTIVSGAASPTKKPRFNVAHLDGNMIRWSSKLEGENVVVKVGVPKGKEDWLDLNSSMDPLRLNGVRNGQGSVPPPPIGVQSDKKRCGVEGCGNERRYRSVKKFEVGGCSMEHLKKVNAKLASETM